MSSIPEKRCVKCEEVKPLSDFSPMKNGPLGVQTRCKKCRNEEQRTKRNSAHPWNQAPRGIPQEKRCKACHEVKPAADFYPEKRNRDELMGKCVACVNYYRG